jgi:hypothetical protein
MKIRRPSSPDVAALIEALKAEGRANRGEEDREDRGKRRREWITIGLLLATFLAICWQVSEMIKVYGPIHDQAVAEQAASKAEDIAAKAAKQQADNAERALAAGQRAWVGPSNATFSAELKIGQPIDITYVYQNTGKEPAFAFTNTPNVSTILTSDQSGAIPLEIQRFMSACRTELQWQGGSVVYPGAASYSSNYQTSKSVVDRDVMTDKKAIIVQGCFHYQTLDSPKYSYFCYFYRKGKTKIQNLNICPSGHDAD